MKGIDSIIKSYLDDNKHLNDNIKKIMISSIQEAYLSGVDDILEELKKLTRSMEIDIIQKVEKKVALISN